MQGDNEPLILHLLGKGDDTLYKGKALVIGTDFLRVAIARFSGYPKSLTYASGYTLNENGAVEVILPLNTTAIENAVQDNESISAFLEVEYSNTDGRVITVLQTPCRVKNDLIDNATSIDLQDQFYDKVYTDEIFSKKSANLSDLLDKETSRTNLEVYSKAETDESLSFKADTKSFESFVNAYNTQKYLESKGAYKSTVHIDKTLDGSFSYMFTYVKGSIGTKLNSVLSIFTPQYYESGDRLYINTTLKKISVKFSMDYDEYVPLEYYDYDLLCDIYSGDKISIIYDDTIFNLKVYVNKILACDINIGKKWNPAMYDLPTGDYFIDGLMFSSALNYSDNSAYNVQSFVKATKVPSFCYYHHENTSEYNFPIGFTGVSDCLFESGITWQGIENCLKIYPTTQTRFQSAKITDIFNGKFESGVIKKIKMKLYYPTTNVQSKIIKLVSGIDFVVYPKDEWQTIEFYKNNSYAKDAYQFVSFRNNTSSNFAGSGTGDDDVIYRLFSKSQGITDFLKIRILYTILNFTYNDFMIEYKLF